MQYPAPPLQWWMYAPEQKSYSRVSTFIYQSPLYNTEKRSVPSDLVFLLVKSVLLRKYEKWKCGYTLKCNIYLENKIICSIVKLCSSLERNMKNSQISHLLTRKIIIFSISLLWQLFFTGKEAKKDLQPVDVRIAWQNLAASSLSLLYVFHMGLIIIKGKK